MPITSSDIQLRQSGSAGLGGAIGSTMPQGFDTVLSSESKAGSIEYRCEYVRNSHASLTLSGAKMWISADTPSANTKIEIGLGTSAIGGVEQIISNEKSAPSGVTFVAAYSEAAALSLGDLGPGQHKAVWLRRTVNALSASSSDTFTRTVIGESPDEAATVQSLWTGVPTSDGAYVSAKMSSTSTANSSRIATSRNSDLSNPSYSTTVSPDSTYRVAKHKLAGLLPDTEYFYGVEVDGVLDRATTGRFKTLPASGPASFSMVFGGCTTNTNDAAFAAINALNPKPLFLLALGDFQYMDIATPTIANYQTAFDNSFASTVRKETHSKIPTVYMWDDHDISDNDASGRDASNVDKSWRATALSFFRSRVPAPFASLSASESPYYSFVVGRVRFVVTDLRSSRTAQSAADNSSKTMMGTTQKAWWKSEIEAAKAAGQVVAWANSVPWIATNNSANIDNWGYYQTERTELANHIKAQDMSGKVFILSSDMHALAIHTGIDYATGGGGVTPVFHAGPFSMNPSSKGGPYTFGPYPSPGSTFVQQYGRMDVVDDGEDLTVTWRGFSADGTQRMSHSFSPISVESVPSKMNAPSATAGNGQATVTFTAPDDGGSPITGYTVSSIPSGGVDSAAGTTSLTRTITNLANGTAYTFNVVASNALGSSTPSDPSNSVTPMIPMAGTFEATGGTITEQGGYRYWTFTGNDTLTVTKAGDVETLVVAGGGAGSTGNSSAGGGGGAGGLRNQTLSISVGTYAITVGAGGIGSTSATGTSGGNSSIADLIVAIGGGFGAPSSSAAGNGGSGGGGGSNSTAPGSGTTGQGFAGGNSFVSTTTANRAGGGGGGAGSVGQNATTGTGGEGGSGVEIWGKRYAGGGGGGSQGTTQGAGRDGGGSGSKSAAAGNGVANTGGGGGGAAVNQRAGDGGSGIVILRRAI